MSKFTIDEQFTICGCVYSSYCRSIETVKRWRKIYVSLNKLGKDNGPARERTRREIAVAREKLALWKKLSVEEF